MRKRSVVLVACLALTTPLLAHRLDQYLQATIVSVAKDQIQASMRLIPGVAVSSAVITTVDLNRDGIFSRAEQQAYAELILHDLSVRIDGRKIRPVLRSVSFSSPAEMKEGLGEIHIDFAVKISAGSNKRTLTLENHHQSAMSVYLMNCLVPQDPNIHLIAQSRSGNQSYYQVEYVQSGSRDSLLSLSRKRIFAALAPFSGVPSMFHLGMRHIAEGTDHLLFLVVLLLPAPLLSNRSHWTTAKGIRRSLIQILRVVTSFTTGHSITLALGASGLISFPERPVEVLIAFSILVSAAHAIRPIFPGREPLIAAGFGLVHGLAFATTLQNLGVGFWQRVASVLGFNAGIEAMQLIVVAAIMPSLIILSQTPAYTFFRFTGALFAGFASLGWIVERMFGVDYSVDLVLNLVARCGAWIAAGLLLTSMASWWWWERCGKPRIVANKALFVST